ALAGSAVLLGLLPAVARLAEGAVLAALEAVAPRFSGADRAVDDPRLAAAGAAGVFEDADAGTFLAADQDAAGRAGFLGPLQAVAVRAGDVDPLLALAERARHLAVLARPAVHGGLVAVGQRLEVLGHARRRRRGAGHREQRLVGGLVSLVGAEDAGEVEEGDRVLGGEGGGGAGLRFDVARDRAGHGRLLCQARGDRGNGEVFALAPAVAVLHVAELADDVRRAVSEHAGVQQHEDLQRLGAVAGLGDRLFQPLDRLPVIGVGKRGAGPPGLEIRIELGGRGRRELPVLLRLREESRGDPGGGAGLGLLPEGFERGLPVELLGSAGGVLEDLVRLVRRGQEETDQQKSGSHALCYLSVRNPVPILDAGS